MMNNPYLSTFEEQRELLKENGLSKPEYEDSKKRLESESKICQDYLNCSEDEIVIILGGDLDHMCSAYDSIFDIRRSSSVVSERDYTVRLGFLTKCGFPKIVEITTDGFVTLYMKESDFTEYGEKQVNLASEEICKANEKLKLLSDIGIIKYDGLVGVHLVID